MKSSSSYRRNGGGVKRARGQTGPVDKAYVNTHPPAPRPAPRGDAPAASSSSLTTTTSSFSRSVLCAPCGCHPAVPPGPRIAQLLVVTWPIPGMAAIAPRAPLGHWLRYAPLFSSQAWTVFLTSEIRTSSTPPYEQLGATAHWRVSAGHSDLSSSSPACIDAIFRGPSPRVPCATTNEACT